ncbi:MAG: Uncharacterized protein CEN87_343 [Parcubacteria group bacterium Licking1014_1]|nr:MAG: Uncharacterized protein CEN87_343 [Parcubacteria group bacterium Licking1014_1]
MVAVELDALCFILNCSFFIPKRRVSKSENPEVTEINWKIVYEMLGMQTEYESTIASLKIAKDIVIWTVPVIKGLTCKKVITCLKKLGVDIKKYIKNPDIEINHNDRDPNKCGSYTISFKRTVEADEENRNLSADDLKKKSVKGITLLERLLLELGYFISTSQHLDVESVTLCAGSRHKNGDIPRVCSRFGILRIYVCWCGSRDQCDHLRPRSAWTGYSAKTEKNK